MYGLILKILICDRTGTGSLLNGLICGLVFVLSRYRPGGLTCGRFDSKMVSQTTNKRKPKQDPKMILFPLGSALSY